MVCESGFEFLPRPYPYPREPFRVDAGERVGYEARYFSIPAFGLLLDKRLFTEASSHPIDEQITLYINKDAGLVTVTEPRLDGSGYEVATPHYAETILDLRDLLEEIVVLHALDSDFSSDEFFISHMQRNRSVYDLPNSSASGVTDLEYVHPAPASDVPVAPSSTSIPSNEIELGAQQFQDIDMDEIMWQPFARLKSFRAIGTRNLPIEPIFPAVLPGGNLPTFTALDQEFFSKLAIDVSSSGGVLITGDALVNSTSLKALTGSGQPSPLEGDFVQEIPWAQFPAGDELNTYYNLTIPGACISASGRQAIYQTPAGLGAESNKVYLANVSDAGATGLLVQNYPANYHATSGIDPNGVAHRGLHVEDKLLYDLAEIGPNLIAIGRSLINGKKVFGHYGDSEAGSKGQVVTGRLKYANGQNVYVYGGITNPAVSISASTSRWEWATMNNRFYPIGWAEYITSALQVRRGAFGTSFSTSWDVGDIMASENEIVWRKNYVQFGASDALVCPGMDRAGGGNLVSDTIFYETHTFREGTDEDGNFIWIELSPPQSPTFTTQTTRYYEDTYSVGNIFSFFLNLKPNNGFVHVNGEVYFQWSEPSDGDARGLRFAPISLASRSTKLQPSTAHNVSIYVVGFFPSWQVRLAVTTNNQITVPDRMNVSPASSAFISIDPSLPITLSDVSIFGPPVWDPDAGLNYLYIALKNGIILFAKMDTSFTITHINQVDEDDGIFAGRVAILDI